MILVDQHSHIAPFTVADLRGRAPGTLEQSVSASPIRRLHVNGRGDDDLNPGLTLNGKRAAAVLVPVVERERGASVVLTLRSDTLPSHPGQIAFPGGKVDDTDAGPVEAALRESHEEIGLEQRFVDVLGFLDTYHTGSGFRILPVVAEISPDVVFTPEPGEVADIFEVPLSFLMNPGNHQIHSTERGGTLRRYYAMPFENRYIWGVTAGILRNLYDRVYSL